MRREPAFSSLDFESPRTSDQKYGDSRQSGMLWSAQFRETPVSTASGSLSVHQARRFVLFRRIGSAQFPPVLVGDQNLSVSIGSTLGRYRQKRSEDPGEGAFPETGNYADFLGLNVSVFRISMIIARSDLKFASNNRHVGTPEENKAFVEGRIAYFGTYSAKQMT
jgi:hypothetical protein